MSETKMRMINAFDADRSDELSPEARALVERRMRLLGPAYRLFYDNPVHIVRGEGVWLYDPEGNAYLDVYNNVASVGHCHPHVIEALAKQAATLNTHTRYLNETVLDYAELACEIPACARARDVHLHGQRGERSRPTRGHKRHRRYRLHRHRTRLSWWDGGSGGGFPVAWPDGRIGEHVRTVPAPSLESDDCQDVAARFASGVAAAIADM